MIKHNKVEKKQSKLVKLFRTFKNVSKKHLQRCKLTNSNAYKIIGKRKETLLVKLNTIITNIFEKIKSANIFEIGIIPDTFKLQSYLYSIVYIYYSISTLNISSLNNSLNKITKLESAV